MIAVSSSKDSGSITIPPLHGEPVQQANVAVVPSWLKPRTDSMRSLRGSKSVIASGLKQASIRIVRIL